MFRILSLSVWAAILLLPAIGMANEVVYDRILVKINDNILTQYDLDEQMKPILEKIKDRKLSDKEKEQLVKLRQQTLERMVNDALMAQEIKKYGIEVSEAAIDVEIKRVRDEQGITEEEFEERVKNDGETIESFRKKLKSLIEKQELLGYMVHSKVLVTDTEIQEEYENRREDYQLEKMVDLAIIMLPPDIAALEVKKRIEDGEYTFAQAAEKYSVGPGKDKGGSIGEVEWSDLADDWRASIEGVSPGGVSTPITVQGKESLLSPVRIIEDRLVPLEDVRDSIFEKLMEAKREKVFDEYFNKLKETAVIIYMD